MNKCFIKKEVKIICLYNGADRLLYSDRFYSEQSITCEDIEIILNAMTDIEKDNWENVKHAKQLIHTLRAIYKANYLDKNEVYYLGGVKIGSIKLTREPILVPSAIIGE